MFFLSRTFFEILHHFFRVKTNDIKNFSFLLNTKIRGKTTFAFVLTDNISLPFSASYTAMMKHFRQNLFELQKVPHFHSIMFKNFEQQQMLHLFIIYNIFHLSLKFLDIKIKFQKFFQMMEINLPNHFHHDVYQI